MRIFFSIVTSLAIATTAFAQLSLQSISHSTTKAPTLTTSGRVEVSSPLQLPFWDDFSYYTKIKPIESFWASSNTVSFNDGMAINPVSLKVATFDGYDASGKPYNILDNGLVKGFADSLVSQPIDLSLVPSEKQNSVYLSFYYQAQGNGELPDTSDKLVVYFKGPLGWEVIDESIVGDASLDPSTFYLKHIQVPPRLFHKAFQFRIRNFGRLSGPYDTWNLDYFYLNVDRSADENSTPDRAITTPLTSLFKDYQSIPYKHFIKDVDGNLSKPTFGLYNFKDGNNQPLNYFSYDTLIQYTNSKIIKTTHPLESFKIILPSLLGLQFRPAVPLSKIPLASYFDKNADSVNVKLKVGLTSRDNDPLRDYLPTYSPIDFRNNDTLRSSYKLFSYYAYDDNVAEYAAGINQAGGELAYLFNMKTTEPDTIRIINIHFPNFNEQANQVFELRIWKTISDTAPVILYKQTVSVRRKPGNQFSSYDIDPKQPPLIVQGSFYVGWKQASSTRMDVGFDANTNSGDKIFYNTNGTWIQNTDLKGSLMIRPVFGKNGTPKPIINAVNETVSKPTLYPNPSKGIFTIPFETEQVIIYDATGAPVNFTLDNQLTEKKIEISNYTGLLIVRLLIAGQWTSHKILIN